MQTDEQVYLDSPQAAKVFTKDDDLYPSWGTKMSAGLDVRSAANVEITTTMGVVLVPTGLIIRPPANHHMELAIRSSLAKKGLMLANGLGIIDEDYCGPDDEIKVALRLVDPGPNFFGVSVTAPTVIKKGDRIAQLLFRKTVRPPLVRAYTAPGENRGGFGSTGK